ncbi:DUF1801 domain-containing protein [Psychroserpens algicola]|uniref:DUF1801 domain-containing protein n=1 Tax=Psychroserpens algicola TaxID=1719034 RepID=A0ABT0HBT1_9FLAO|nr:DUF1801 domain-containing protein [Psychroserpens algicola]MCK8481662.1 DUF1801 domain-containing protein [Psychroserpens algicola]
MNATIDNYLDNLKQWQKELTILRQMIAGCGLTEEFKWMHPCYTYDKKNIVLIHGFKNYCAILFHKGALLKDTNKILIQQTEHTQSARQIRFTNTSEILQLEPVIKAYIYEAVEIEKAGLSVNKKPISDYDIPDELTNLFSKNPEVKTAFYSLTKGRQKGYLLHFSKPKQAKTRISRIEKNIKRILDGKGLNDCICGLSKRMPNCDGSHKLIKHGA